MLPILSTEKWSAVISLCVSIVILIASFKQWWGITYDGAMITKNWVKVLFIFCILLLSIALILLLM